MTILDQITFNTAPGPLFEADQPGSRLDADPLVKLIAFYLPQFHPIPENDAWWGEGFTEWTNVTKAVPRFAGHYQPRLPGSLGFYDLRQADMLHKQAALARRYGVAGFCFHHYWFAGKRILQTPLEVLLSRPDIDLPFFVNWANENWTRRWDGYDQDILLAQCHSTEDDLEFAKSLEPLFRDPRYMRINGRPLLMLYHPSILPNAADTVQRWRTHFQSVGLGNPFIMMAQAFNDGDPEKYGMDAAVGFPPFWAGWDAPRLQRTLDLNDPKFRGDVVDYEVMASATVAGYGTTEPFFPGVCPAWDNEARKPGRGFCFTGSTPEKYGRWLNAACRYVLRTHEPERRVVFINAWNEWAEGAYLEPDRHFGHAYLAETARVLNGLVTTMPSDGDGSAIAPMDPHRAASDNHQAHKVVGRTVHRVANKLAGIADAAAERLRRL